MTTITINETPKIYSIDNFLTQNECKHLISLGRNKFRKAIVSGSGTGHNTRSTTRTNDVAWISHSHDNVTKLLCQRISKLVNIPIENAEQLQLLQYKPGTFFLPHCDAYKRDGSSKSKHCLMYGGQRLITCLLYLNDVESGGETKFTKVNKTVKPKSGKIVVFHNCDEYKDVDEMTQHEACRVNKGVKYAVNLWFREANMKEKFIFIPLKKYSTTLTTFYRHLGIRDKLKGIISHQSNIPELENDLLNTFKSYHENNKYIFNIQESQIRNFNDFLVIKNVVPKDLLSKIQNYYAKCIESSKFVLGDSQTKRYKCNDDIISRVMQFELLEFVKTMTQTDMTPTYTYFSGYIKGYELPSHTDNDKCEITASCVISSSSNDHIWPIYLEQRKNTSYKAGPKPTPHKNDCYKICADVGDLILFRGKYMRHFREKLEIDNYNVTLLHYKS